MTINNWTATNELLEIGNKRKYYNDDKAKILFVGWLEDFKGVFELLNVIKIILQENSNLTMTFVGDGSAMQKQKNS